ncbi:MAG: hypothetical protein AB7F86_02545 [Bdellovibrionales bacterium]
MSTLTRVFRHHPEILRHLWLEISPLRLLIVPFVLILVAAMSWTEKSSYYDNLGRILTVLRLSTVLILFVYGSWLAAQSFLSEVNGNTWVFQRLSAIPPWRMTLGKLFGGPIYAWYGALISGGLYLLVLQTCDLSILAKNRNFQTPYLSLVAIVAGGLLSHALSILVAIAISRRSQGRDKTNAFFSVFLGGFLATYLWSYALRLTPVYWFWQESTEAMSGILTVGTLTIFAILGVGSEIKGELSRPSLPWVYPLFAVVLTVLIAGFSVGDEDINYITVLQWPLLIFGALTLLLAMAHRHDPVEFRHLLQTYRERKFTDLLRSLPIWLVSFAILTGLGLIALALRSGVESSVTPTAIWFVKDVSLDPLKLLFLAARDVSLIILIGLQLKRRHADLMLFFCFGLLYVVFPTLFVSSSAKTLFMAFYPITNSSDQGPLTLLAVVAQALFAGGTCAILLTKRR